MPSDFASIRKLNDLAFDQPQKGILVNKIRAFDQSAISLVAEYEMKLLDTSFTIQFKLIDIPKYYPKFGFENASKYSLESQWPGVPDEAFIVMILDDATIQNVSGAARYRPEWDEAT